MSFPLDLDLHSFITEKDKVIKENICHTKFQLKSVILHEGTATSGHYQCFVRPNVKTFPDYWLRYNDNIVSEVTFDTVKEESFGGISRRIFGGGGSIWSKNAYILQYTREKQTD